MAWLPAAATGPCRGSARPAARRRSRARGSSWAGAEQAALIGENVARRRTCSGTRSLTSPPAISRCSFGDAREHARVVRGQDHDGPRVLHDQRADLRRRLGRQLVARAALVGAQVGAQEVLLFARQRADVAGVGDVVVDRRDVALTAAPAPPPASARSSRPRADHAQRAGSARPTGFSAGTAARAPRTRARRARRPARSTTRPAVRTAAARRSRPTTASATTSAIRRARSPTAEPAQATPMPSSAATAGMNPST